MNAYEKAYSLLKQWQGDKYVFGTDVSDQLGKLVVGFGKKVLLVSSKTYEKQAQDAIQSICAAGGEVIGNAYVPGAKPNAPKEDVYRLESYILHYHPDVVVELGAGSSIDACKAAIALSVLGDVVTPELDHYFGVGIVSKELENTGRKMIPYVAVQTCASSGAHLTKYSNVTDPVAGQKKLIVDVAGVPAASLFDYSNTVTMPMHVSIDGALDGMAHTFEVFCGAKPEYYDLAKDIVETAWDLILSNTKKVMENPKDVKAREALGLATDLGGYAIMVGGTSGAHLTSFSLVDLGAHGTACGIMNPYYAVFYASAIQEQLLVVGNILKKHGFICDDPASVEGRERAILIAKGMIAFGRSINAPTTLGELPGFSEKHVERILSAAKDPSLSSKLQNMPVKMTSEDVDTYMAPVIHAAVDGQLEKIINK